jgi:hypothetical protein
VIATVLAVRLAGWLPPDFAVTTTHEPTVTSASVPLVVFVNVVLDVKFTVVWPLVFCTSRLDADTAAAVPNAPGGGWLPWLGAAARVVLAGGADDGGVELPPHAAMTVMATVPATSARPGSTRRRARRSVVADACADIT